MKIADLTHYVVLCSMHDVVTSDGEMRLAREGIAGMWASIEQSRGSTFSKEGYAVMEPGGKREVRSHRIVVRQRVDLDISAMAWVYERKRKSPSRWFKVLGGADKYEDGQFFTMDCMLVERSDTTTPPVARVPESTPQEQTLGPVAPPAWVKL